MNTRVDFTLACARANADSWEVFWTEKDYLVGHIQEIIGLNYPASLDAITNVILSPPKPRK